MGVMVHNHIQVVVEDQDIMVEAEVPIQLSLDITTQAVVVVHHTMVIHR